MNTEIRLRELNAINNNIIGECEKMMEYLHIIKEKSEYAITFLNSLSPPNILRRCSSTHEYLNKFYIKLLDQNCLFELFFLELDDSLSAADFYQTKGSVSNESVDVTKSNSIKNKFADLDTSLSKQTKHISTRMNVNARQFSPRNAFSFENEDSTNETETRKEEDLELNTENIQCNVVKDQSIHNIVDLLTSENLTQAELSEESDTQSRNCFYNDESHSESSSSLLSSSFQVNEKMKKSDYKLIDIQSTIKQINNKIKEFELKNSISIPDLRPSVRKIEILPNNSSEAEKTTVNSVKDQSTQNVVDLLTSKNVTQGELSEVNDNYNNKNNSESSSSLISSSFQVKEKIKTDSDDKLIDVQSTIKKLNNKMKEIDVKNGISIPDLRPSVRKTEILPNNSSEAEKPTVNVKAVEKEKNKDKLHPQKERFHQNIVITRGSLPREKELCYLSYIESPSEFYIQVVREDNTLIDTLSDQIAEFSHSLKTFHSKAEARRMIETYCICYIDESSSWCRVAIIDWQMENEDILKVKLIDHGHISQVSLRNIRLANQYFFTLPVMADKCKLAWVKPSDDTEDWLNDSITYFKKITTDQLFTFAYVESEEDYLVIDLQNNEIDSVAGLMIAEGNATFDKSKENKTWSNSFMRQQMAKAQGFNENELKLNDEDRLEALIDEEDDEEVSDPNLAVTHYNPKDETEVCRFFLANGYCFKRKNCSFSHIQLNPDGWTTDRESLYFETFNQLELPPPGSEITVKIVHIVDLRTFYVVVKNLPECVNLIGSPVCNIRALVRLMNDPVEIKSYKSLVVTPALGELILVQYQNGKWQRARVIGVEEFANKVDLEVFLVDFGCTTIVNLKHCRRILEKHLHLPFQVVMCTLCDTSIKEDLSEENFELANDYLEMNVHNKKLKAKVMCTSHYLTIHLFTESGKNIGLELIKAGILNSSTLFVTNPEYGLLLD